MNKKIFLKKRDPELWSLLKKETRRQEEEIELIASENYASRAVLETMASVLNNKYSEGYPGKRYYGGNFFIDEIEKLAIERLKKLFRAEHANVQALSGSPANMAAYMALLKPGDKVLGLKLDHGGHLTHGHSVNFSGRLYSFVPYGLNEAGLIDMEELRDLALREKPQMIVAGFSAYSRNLDWRKFKEIADEVGAYTLADISHLAGLIAADCLESPVPYFDVVTSTTHKTLRGPRGAFILSKEKFAKQIDRAVFPGIQGGPHNHVIAAKAVAFKEALDPKFKIYAQQILSNAQVMAQEFIKKNYQIVSGGTDNHLMVLDLRSKNISGLEAEQILERVGISVSRSTVPADPASPLNPSGLRLGSPAITSRGFKEKEVINLVKLIDEALMCKDDIPQIDKIKKEIKKICRHLPIY